MKDIRYADDIVLISDTERKLSDEVVKESEQKVLTIYCNKTEWRLVSKTNFPRCLLSDFKIIKVQKCKHIEIFFIDKGIYEAEVVF